MRNKSLMRLAVCLIGMAAMVLQGCSESGTDRDKLCGSWSSRTCWYIRKGKPTR